MALNACMALSIGDRLKVLNMFRGFEVPVDDPTLARFHVWSRALFERPSIQGTMHFLKEPGLFIKACADASVLFERLEATLVCIEAN